MSQPRFLAAMAGLPVWPPPVWIMRQAGRYLPEYRQVRAEHDFLTVCRSPQLACEVTLQPLRRFGLDAAIVFSDIMMPLLDMGVELTFDPGPRLPRPLCTAADVARLRVPKAGSIAPAVMQTLRRLRQQLTVPLIGFAGAPLTLAAYLVEGGGSRDYPLLRRMLWQDPNLFVQLLQKLGEMTARYLTDQVHHGAQAVQVFDSWAGLVGPDSYRDLVLPVMQTLWQQLGSLGVPRIYFAHHAAQLWPQVAEQRVEAFGVDWRTPLVEARRALPVGSVLQGNLDPAALLGDVAGVRRATAQVLEDARRAAGPYVFNLGHGILPQTPIAHVEAMLAQVAAA